MDLPALGAQHPQRRGVDVAEEHALDAALHERDGPALGRRLDVLRPSAAAGSVGLGAARARASTSAARPAPAARASGRAWRPGASARSRAGMGEDARRSPCGSARSCHERASERSICGRTRSISLSYCTPDGHAVTHAMQPEAAVEVGDHLGRDRLALLVADPHQHDPPARRVHLVLEDRVGRARRQAEAAVHAVLDQLRLGRVLVVSQAALIFLLRRRPGGRSGPGRSAPSGAPSRPGRAGVRPLVPTRAAPSSTVQCARRERLRGPRATRQSALGANAIHESPSAARETTRARRPAARITSGRSVGRPETFSTAPSAALQRAHVVPVDVDRTSPTRAAPARAPTAPENCSRMRPEPAGPDDVEAVGLERPPRELEHRARAARPGRRSSIDDGRRRLRQRVQPHARPSRSARASRTSPRTASPGHSPRRS